MAEWIYYPDTLDKKSQMIHWYRHINSIKTEETQKQLSDPNHQL